MTASEMVSGAASWCASWIVAGLDRLATGGLAALELTIGDDLSAREAQALVHRLRRVAQAPRIGAILLRWQGRPGGWAWCRDVRDALVAVRQRGIRVHVWIEAPDNGAMWVASACDRVFVPESTQVLLLGLGTESLYFAGALDRFGVEADLEAAGEYKSFGEPFTRRFPSVANREALQAILRSLQDELVSGIAEGRGLAREQVDAVLARGPLSPQDAQDAGLVDVFAYFDEAKEQTLKDCGPDAGWASWRGWCVRDAFRESFASAWFRARRVAVLHLEGAIVMDDTGSSTRIRARKVIEAVDELREDDAVKAVVLRVTSPGGDAVASDLIWRAVERLRDEKPVVASYGDIAASGGVYLAAAAHEIVCQPTTLTGSIGVFGGKVVVRGALRRQGVTAQACLAAPNATLFSPFQRFTPPQRARFRASLERTYNAFVDRVARGRGVEPEVVEPSCRGRVWTGRDALDRKLVDRLGGLEMAVDRARERAGLQAGAFRTVHVEPVSPQPLRELLTRLALQRVPGWAAVTHPVQRWLSEDDAVWQLLADLPSRPLAMMPPGWRWRG